MKTFTATFCIIVGLFVSDCFADMHTYCESEWPNNYIMQEHCVKTQTQAIRNLGEFKKKHNIKDHKSTMGMIFVKCLVEWDIPEFNFYNYVMAEHCIKTQTEAYNRMKQKK